MDTSPAFNLSIDIVNCHFSFILDTCRDGYKVIEKRNKKDSHEQNAKISEDGDCPSKRVSFSVNVESNVSNIHHKYAKDQEEDVKDNDIEIPVGVIHIAGDIQVIED